MGSVALKAVSKKGTDDLITKYASAFEISAIDIDGNERKLSEMGRGKKCIMVVNVATK